MNYPLSPLDGRYAAKVSELGTIFSEFGLMKYRTRVEIEWLIFLSENGIAPVMDEGLKIGLQTVMEEFSEEEFQKIKDTEAVTNHDVKAVEYLVRALVPEKFWPWIHFACTSEDINNTSYGLMIRDGVSTVMSIFESSILDDLREKSVDWKSIPMLCRTHGQNATPSTMGKEMAVFYHRLNSVAEAMHSVSFLAKINGATGNYAAHVVAFPELDWIELSREFIEDRLALTWNPLTTQIESHDAQAAILNNLSQLSSIMIDLCRDIWGYVSLGYFGQKMIAGEVGSSTMPHKVNPIDFENAEGNLKLARGVARTLADELPISRWQRDLTDSTLQRNFGLVFGHFLLALRSLSKGLGKLEIKEEVLFADLRKAPEILTEAVQTVLRKNGHHDAYEQLKDFSRGRALTFDEIQEFIKELDIDDEDKKRLQNLKTENYTGLSEKLVEDFIA